LKPNENGTVVKKKDANGKLQKYTVGEKIVFRNEDGKVVAGVFRGRYRPEMEKYPPGIYWSVNKGKLVSKKGTIEAKDIPKKNEHEDILNVTDTLKRQTGSKIAKIHSNEAEVARPRKNDGNDILHFSINDNDDVLVRKIKAFVNSKRVKLKDCKVNPEFKYNMVNSLRYRNAVKFATAEDWAKFFGCKITVSIDPIDPE
jgi:hypothetical protein